MSDQQGAQQRLKFKPKEESAAKVKIWRNEVACMAVGTKMEDGTIFAGKLANGKKVYVMPRNESLSMNFNVAAAHAARANNNKTLGYDDWRIPTKEELELLYKNKDKGALKGTFKHSNLIEQETDGDYWSSTKANSSATLPVMYVQRLSDGSVGRNSTGCRGIVRLVR